jgi:hypothetical protein
MSRWRISPNHSVRQWTCQDFGSAIRINRRPLPSLESLDPIPDERPTRQISLGRSSQVVPILMTGNSSANAKLIPNPLPFGSRIPKIVKPIRVNVEVFVCWPANSSRAAGTSVFLLVPDDQF